MTKQIEYYYDIVQHTDEWFRVKHGVVSASVFKNIITAKTLKLSMAEKTTTFFDQILSERVDETIYPSFMNYAMQRGLDDEPYAVQQYAEQYNQEYKYCGFVINRQLGFPLGFSPDALIGEDGFIEIKSKEPKLQIKTILDHVCGRSKDLIPSEHMMQCQAGLFVTQREWCDFISFCNGFPMATIRVHPIAEFQEAIADAAIEVERVLQQNQKDYECAVKNNPQLTITPRRKIELEITL